MRSDLLDRFAATTQTIREPEQLRTYECDGLTGHRVIPALVALPGSVEEVEAVVRLCDEERIPFVARGAGTGLSGGALPVAEGIVISLARLTRILEVDVARGCVVVEPGVANLDVTRAVADAGFYYAPDPSSQQVCTIGGNVAENSGGAHCLKYGFTVNHVLAAEIVLPDGEVVELSVWDEGPGLLGAFIGSEGTLGIATKLTLRVLRAPEAVRTLLAGFGHTDEAGGAVSDTISQGILPAAIEMMDAVSIEAAEAAVNANYPEGCGAVLIVELDGPLAQVERDLERVEAICRGNAANEILVACIDAGGSITGEHGVGSDKACSMPLMFGEADLEAMLRLRAGFDPNGLANPGKVFPTPRLCGEVPGPYRAHPLEKAGLIE